MNDIQATPCVIFDGRDTCIPIVMAASEAYLPYVCVAICSLLEHSDPAKLYKIHILHREQYSADAIQSIYDATKKWGNCIVQCLNVDSVQGVHIGEHISADTYTRLLLPELFPQYDKMLYLDSDLIVCRDVAELFNTPCDEGTLLSGVVDIDVLGQYHGPESSMRYYLHQILHIQHPEQYLQAGVLLFHLDALRKKFGTMGLVNASAGCRLRYYDQDVLNHLCNGNIQLIDMKWNVVNGGNGYRLSHIVKNAPQTMYQEYLDARHDPWIVHFSGECKPWNDTTVDMGDYFWAVIERHQLVVPVTDERTARPAYKKIADILLPLASKRRENFKKVYFRCKYHKSKSKEKDKEDGKRNCQISHIG